MIYRPNTPPRADLDIFTDTVIKIMEIINSEQKVAFLLGDFNIDLLKYQTHQKTNDYINNVFSESFLPLITKPTRVTHESATLIDHIYSNEKTHDSLTGIIVTDDVADHFGVFHILYGKSHIKPPSYIYTRKINEHTMHNFKLRLAETEFNSVLQEQDTNIAYDKFIDIYCRLFEEIFPIKKVSQ